MLGFNRYILSFDKRGRFVEKRFFNIKQRLEGAAYIKAQQRKGYIVEEISNEEIYNKYKEG